MKIATIGNKISNAISRFFKKQSDQKKEVASTTASRFNFKLSKSDTTEREKKLTRRQRMRLEKNHKYRSYKYMGYEMQGYWFGTFSKLFTPVYELCMHETPKTHFKKCHGVEYTCKAEKKAIKRAYRDLYLRRAV